MAVVVEGGWWCGGDRNVNNYIVFPQQSSGARQTGQSSNSEQDASNDEDDNYENMADNIFHMKPDRRTLDISKVTTKRYR